MMGGAAVEGAQPPARRLAAPVPVLPQLALVDSIVQLVGFINDGVWPSTPGELGTTGPATQQHPAGPANGGFGGGSEELPIAPLDLQSGLTSPFDGTAPATAAAASARPAATAGVSQGASVAGSSNRGSHGPLNETWRQRLAPQLSANLAFKPATVSSFLARPSVQAEAPASAAGSQPGPSRAGRTHSTYESFADSVSTQPSGSRGTASMSAAEAPPLAGLLRCLPPVDKLRAATASLKASAGAAGPAMSGASTGSAGHRATDAPMTSSYPSQGAASSGFGDAAQGQPLGFWPQVASHLNHLNTKKADRLFRVNR